jgi:hypothetical protein
MRTREWLKSTDPGAMLWDVSANATLHPDAPEAFARPALRRLLLFVLHVFRPLIEQTDIPTCRAAAELAWQLADGTAATDTMPQTRAALSADYDATWEASRQYHEMPRELATRMDVLNVLARLLDNPATAARNVFPPDATPALVTGSTLPIDSARACALLREIFGERGRLLVEPEWRAEWRTDTVLALARQMYDSEQFGAMPILADALQDAGCDNAKVLAHCRDPKATHVRGCWVIDTVLGKV